jgi:hypothetical protein
MPNVFGVLKAEKTNVILDDSETWGSTQGAMIHRVMPDGSFRYFDLFELLEQLPREVWQRAWKELEHPKCEPMLEDFYALMHDQPEE